MLELVVLAGTLAAAGWVAGAQAHRRIAAARALDRYSQSRGLVFVPTPTHQPRTSPRVLGSKDDVAYVVELVRLGPEVRTRVSATTRRGRGPSLSVLQRSAFPTTKCPALVTGDDSFDRAYIVTAGESEDAEGLRRTSSLMVLEQRCRGVWLASDGLKIAVSWRGTESDPVVIDAARDVVVEVAGWHRSEAPYR